MYIISNERPYVYSVFIPCILNPFIYFLSQYYIVFYLTLYSVIIFNKLKKHFCLLPHKLIFFDNLRVAIIRTRPKFIFFMVQKKNLVLFKNINNGSMYVSIIVIINIY